MLIRGIGAIPIGIAIGFLIPLVISISRGRGTNNACYTQIDFKKWKPANYHRDRIQKLTIQSKT